MMTASNMPAGGLREANEKILKGKQKKDGTNIAPM
jgi:hypothetical protein